MKQMIYNENYRLINHRYEISLQNFRRQLRAVDIELNQIIKNKTNLKTREIRFSQTVFVQN